MGSAPEAVGYSSRVARLLSGGLGAGWALSGGCGVGRRSGLRVHDGVVAERAVSG